jgi:hypothetical protein
MESLICNVYITMIKAQKTVSINAASVEEVVDVGDDEGPQEAEVDEGRVAGKGLLEGRPVGVMKITEGGVDGGGGAAGVRANSERGDVKNLSLECVRGTDDPSVKGKPFKRGYGGEAKGGGKEVVPVRELEEGRELGFSYWPPNVTFFVTYDVILVGVKAL